MIGRGWGKNLVRGNGFHKILNKDVSKKQQENASENKNWNRNTPNTVFFWSYSFYFLVSFSVEKRNLGEKKLELMGEY